MVNREEHQPQAELPKRPRRTTAQMREACGNVVAFVLPAAKPQLAKRATAQAEKAGCAAVLTLAKADYPRAAVQRKAADFELFGLPFGLLMAMHKRAMKVCKGYTHVLVLEPAMEKITAQHLFELCEDAQQHAAEGTEVVASWIQWFRRPPYVIAREFLEQLPQTPYTALNAQGVRPVPAIAARDHAFGEEPLGVAAAMPPAWGAFLQQRTMGALEAVHLAQWAAAHPKEEPVSPNQPLSLLGPVKPQPLNDADKKLFDAARSVLRAQARAVKALPADQQADLAWADEFAQRNKRDFPLFSDRAHAGKLVYLDSAATSQRLAAVVQAQNDFDLHENANVYRGSYQLSAQATFTYNDARKRIEDFIGAERRQTVLCANASAACALVAQAWGEHHIGEGDLIVTTIAEHHSNMVPFFMLAQRKGARIEYLPLDQAGRIDRTAYAQALEEHPKLVCFAHVGNVLGLLAPAEELAAEAHAVGARVLLDAAHTFGHMPLDVQKLGIDWLAFSAHKAYGPMGIGGLWIAPEAFDEMDPLVGGGGTVSHVSTEGYYLRPKVIQYELGTPAVSQAVGFAAAVDYLDGLGMENIVRHTRAMTRYLVAGLQRIDGLTIVGDHTQDDGLQGLVSFTMRGVDPNAIAGFLGQLDVAIRSGSHCAIPLHARMGMLGTGRISLGVYTTRDDIDAALTALTCLRDA